LQPCVCVHARATCGCMCACKHNFTCTLVMHMCKFLTTTKETSQNSSKWSHYSTDHKKYIDLSIRPPFYFKILGLETPCQTWLFHKTFGHLVCYCFSAAVELILSEWYWKAVIFWFWHWQKRCQLKSALFKETVAWISILSKLWYFLLWFVLKVPQFWKNRDSCKILCDPWNNGFILKSFEKFPL